MHDDWATKCCNGRLLCWICWIRSSEHCALLLVSKRAAVGSGIIISGCLPSCPTCCMHPYVPTVCYLVGALHYEAAVGAQSLIEPAELPGAAAAVGRGEQLHAAAWQAVGGGIREGEPATYGGGACKRAARRVRRDRASERARQAAAHIQGSPPGSSRRRHVCDQTRPAYVYMYVYVRRMYVSVRKHAQARCGVGGG
jgi:hypothetical protein